MLRAMIRLKTRQGTRGGRVKTFKLLRNDSVIVFVLRYHYVAGESNRMSHHRSLNCFEIRFYDSYEPFRL